MPPIQKAVQEVLRAEQAWLQAHRRVDVEVLAQLVHPDYSTIQPGGAVLQKAKALASYRSGERHWEAAEIDELTVRVYGDTAIVVGRWRAKGVNQGEAFDYAARYTSVWVKEAGRWQMVSDQSTPLGD